MRIDRNYLKKICIYFIFVYTACIKTIINKIHMGNTDFEKQVLESLSEIKTDVSGLKTDVSSLHGKFDRLDDRLDSVEENLTQEIRVQ